MNSAPFTTVAYAGHVISGYGYCECGAANCICDPGEVRTQRADMLGQPTANDAAAQSDKGVALDAGAGVMLLTLVLLFGLRLRF